MPSDDKDEQEKDISAGNHVLSYGIILRTTANDWHVIEEFLKTRSSTKLIHVRRSENPLWVIPV